jgi:endonuclease/exonuclease/phosphatase family metal-dependent hydrolase
MKKNWQRSFILGVLIFAGIVLMSLTNVQSVNAKINCDKTPDAPICQGGDDTPKPPPKPKTSPVDSTPKTEVKVMSFNLAMGAGAIGQDRSGATQAEYIKNKGADIVFLQEVDVNTKRSGPINLAQAIAARSGLQYYQFRKHESFDGGEYGIAVISRFPLSNVEVYPTPWPEFWWWPANWPTPRHNIMMTMQANIGSKSVTLLANHWPSGEEASRKSQRMEAAKLISSLNLGSDLIIAGDLNAQFTSPEVQMIMGKQNLQRARSASPKAPSNDCHPSGDEIDHILFRGRFTAIDFDNPCGAPGVILSDHPIPMAQLRL